MFNRTIGPDCAVICNLLNAQTHTHTHIIRWFLLFYYLLVFGELAVTMVDPDRYPRKRHASGEIPTYYKQRPGDLCEDTLPVSGEIPCLHSLTDATV